MGDSITENWVKGDPSLFYRRRRRPRHQRTSIAKCCCDSSRTDHRLHPEDGHTSWRDQSDVAGNTGPALRSTIFRTTCVPWWNLRGRTIFGSRSPALPPASAFSWQPALRPRETIERLNAWLQGYAGETHSRFINYYAVLNDGRGGLKANFSNDGVHPNSNGYAVMRRLAQEGIQ